jgi:hypothetical protein
MKKEHSNKSTERILLLLVLLLQGTHSREDIFARLPVYRRDAKTDAQRKMLDRDLATLEHVGIRIERRYTDRGVVLYSVLPKQFNGYSFADTIDINSGGHGLAREFHGLTVLPF